MGMDMYAALLGRASSGGGGGSDTFIVHEDENTLALDKTYDEIRVALGAGRRVVVLVNDASILYASQVPLLETHQDSEAGSYVVIGYGNGETVYYETDNVNGYPVLA